jgi:hypothetical protein
MCPCSIILISLDNLRIEMIVVRRCEDRNALAAFLFPVCLSHLKREFPFPNLTPESLAAALALWDTVEFFDTEKEVIVGAAARELNHYLHIYVDSCRRVSWGPHTSLQAALDIFLLDSDRLYAAIPLVNRNTISMVCKLGFVHTRSEGSVAFHELTPQTRKMFMCRTRPRLCQPG